MTNNAVWPGYNDLKTINPELAEEWDYQRNRITPDKVSPNSNKKVWWICSRCGNNWMAYISNRNRGRGCVKC